MNYDELEKFNIEFIINKNSFEKIRVAPENLIPLMSYLKNNSQFDFNRLNTIIAVDLGVEENKFEVIYDLNSLQSKANLRISVLISRDSPHIPSVVSVFKSAYFDECEIFDLFGINFDSNPNLKRLLMPKGWIGFPLRKDYVQDDERLNWNNV